MFFTKPIYKITNGKPLFIYQNNQLRACDLNRTFDCVNNLAKLIYYRHYGIQLNFYKSYYFKKKKTQRVIIYLLVTKVEFKYGGPQRSKQF